MVDSTIARLVHEFDLCLSDLDFRVDADLIVMNNMPRQNAAKNGISKWF